jgi:hypothetical protein
MTDKPSPFAGLDKALLRSTRSQENPAAPPQPLVAQESKPTQTDAPANIPDQEQPPTPSRQPRKRKEAAQNKPADSEASELASMNASSLASLLASELAHQDEMIARVRKTVRTPGKEVSFVRLTPEEKQQLAEIVYSYKRQGKKTSETEISRIAINCLLDDHRTNGEQSLLARVIDALLA